MAELGRINIISVHLLQSKCNECVKGAAKDLLAKTGWRQLVKAAGNVPLTAKAAAREEISAIAWAVAVNYLLLCLKCSNGWALWLNVWLASAVAVSVR
jgi:hypothetical protein